TVMRIALLFRLLDGSFGLRHPLAGGIAHLALLCQFFGGGSQFPLDLFQRSLILAGAIFELCPARLQLIPLALLHCLHAADVLQRLGNARRLSLGIVIRGLVLLAGVGGRLSGTIVRTALLARLTLTGYG